MKYFLDTEFSEKPGQIELISIGIVAEDGRTYYAANQEIDYAQCNQWVTENVLSKLNATVQEYRCKVEMRDEILAFVGDDLHPEFWGYYADYDWVVFCWLFGAMIDLPKGFPMYCRDLKQEIDRLGLDIHQSEDQSHNALDDARWIAKTWRQIFT